MIAFAKRVMDEWLGRGDAAVTQPVMDGPFKPNQTLELAPRVMTVADLDNLVATAGGILFSSGAEIGRLGERESRRFEAPVSFLASSGDMVAVGLDSGGVTILGGSHDGKMLGQVELPCPTAAAFLDPDTLIVANGSAERRTVDWRRDLMSHGRSGSLWRLPLRGGRPSRMRGDLAWPAGVGIRGNDRIFVSECWRHRVVAVDVAKPTLFEVVLSRLPAYPGRIAKAESGGFWVSFISVRNQLVDFVLREHKYRRRMMAEVPEPFWIAPALASNQSFEEPLQGSGLKQMGMLKPWAATRSYGLVARCDEELQPLFSFHSRAGGTIHGVCSVCEDGEDLLVGAKGPGVLVRIEGVAAAMSEGGVL